MFLVNSCLGLFTAASFEAPLLPKLRGQLAEFLNNPSPVGLRILFLSTCVGLRYGHRRYPQNFSRPSPRMLPYFYFGPLRPGLPTPGSCPFQVSFCLNLLVVTECQPYVHRLRLSFSPISRYSFRHSHFCTVHCRFRYSFSPYRTLSYHNISFNIIPSFGVNFSPVKSSAQGHSTSELLRTLLMSGCF